MKVGVATQWFPPERATIVRQWLAALRKAGHHVDVLTGYPNYPEGHLYPGYKLRPYMQEIFQGAIVHRAPLFPSHSRRATPRALNYLSFAAAATAVAGFKVPRPDVWAIYSSPATSAIPILYNLRHRHVPTLLVIQDLWPDSVMDAAMLNSRVARRAERALTRLCAELYRRSTLVGVISPTMRDVLISRGVSDEKIVYVPNWITDSHLHPAREPSMVERRRLGLPTRGPLFIYAGNLGTLQSLDTLVDAFARTPDASLVLLGNGTEKQRLQDRARGYPNISVLPGVPLNVVGDYLASADFVLISLADTPLLRVTMPSKVQASLAAGRPILGHVAGDAAEVIRRSGAGVTTPPGDVSALVAEVRRLSSLPLEARRQMARNARSYYEQEFSADVGEARFNDVLERAAAGTHFR